MCHAVIGKVGCLVDCASHACVFSDYITAGNWLVDLISCFIYWFPLLNLHVKFL